MTRTWILVANASVATVYSNEGPNKGLIRVKTLAHAASREKGSDLVSDRPGHSQSQGNGHGAFVAAKSPKEVEAQRFALELARAEQGTHGTRLGAATVGGIPSLHGIAQPAARSPRTATC